MARAASSSAMTLSLHGYLDEIGDPAAELTLALLADAVARVGCYV